MDREKLPSLRGNPKKGVPGRSKATRRPYLLRRHQAATLKNRGRQSAFHLVASCGPRCNVRFPFVFHENEP
eukprot:scaffold26185_cov62-Phaeocystis_antarctica.AAC.4